MKIFKVMLAIILIALPVRADTVSVEANYSKCTKGGAIPTCIAKTNWDCIEGPERTEDHCDVSSRGCNIEIE